MCLLHIVHGQKNLILAQTYQLPRKDFYSKQNPHDRVMLLILSGFFYPTVLAVYVRKRIHDLESLDHDAHVSS